MWAVWCVGTLKFSRIPLCVGSVLCGVWRLWNLQSSTACGRFGLWKLFKGFYNPLVCGDFENFQSSPVCVPVLETLKKFRKNPLYWRDWFFRVKFPVLPIGKSSALWLWKKNVAWSYGANIWLLVRNPYQSIQNSENLSWFSWFLRCKKVWIWTSCVHKKFSMGCMSTR